MNDNFHILGDDPYSRELAAMLRDARRSNNPALRKIAAELLRLSAEQLQLPPDQRQLTGRETAAWLRQLAASPRMPLLLRAARLGEHLT